MSWVEIRVEGHLEPGWENWLDDFRISHAENNQTILIGEIKDQTALHKLIGRLCSLGLKLVSVRLLE